MIKHYSEIHGWCDFDDLYEHYSKILTNDGVFVELGVWMGRSICSLGQRILTLGKTPKIFAVDTFKGSDNEAEGHAPMVKECGGSTLSIFKSNMEDLGISKLITIIENDSFAASQTFLDNEIDILFIDANHSYEYVINDLNYWYPKVKSGGILSGHDYSWDTVKQATKDFSKNKNLKVSAVSNNCWIMQKQYVGQF